MTSSLRHIPARRLGASESQLRYLEDDPDLQQIIGSRPRSAEDLMRAAPLNARRLVPPAELAAAFERYARAHEAPDQVLANARQVADGGTFMVVTGQQPGLFGGPLYAIHKAATAVRLARELSALPDGPRVVPVFWNHTDDHDLDEANRAFLVNQNQELQRFRLDLESSGEPLFEIGIGRRLGPVLDEIGSLFPETEFKEWALGLFRPRHADETFGAAMARMLFGLFGDSGLLVIEPRALPGPAFDVLPKWCDLADEIRDRCRLVSEELTDIGLDVTLDPGSTLMFHLSGGRRVSLADGEHGARATDLSPGVLLRPIWQDAVLPTIGFVVGPGELAYLSVAAPLYKQLGVPRPVLVPRASLTLVEPSLAKLLSRFGWDLPELGAGFDDLQRRVREDGDDETERELEDLARRTRAELERIAGSVRRTDPDLVRAVERVRNKVGDEIEKLQQRLRASRNQREGVGARQIRRLCSHLRPRGRLQERVLSPLPFLVAHGRELAAELIAASDPFAVHHGVLEL